MKEVERVCQVYEEDIALMIQGIYEVTMFGLVTPETRKNYDKSLKKLARVRRRYGKPIS